MLYVLTPIIILLLVAMSALRVLNEYERGVVFRLGRVIGAKGPGVVLLIPLIDRMVKVDMRRIPLQVPSQEIITRDNVPTKVNAVAFFKVYDAQHAIVEVENYALQTMQKAQTILRSVLGQHHLDELLAERDKINHRLQELLDAETEPWGIKVESVEVKDVEIPHDMQRAMAAQAEAERERRAKVINAEGEFQASQKLLEAANVMSQNPITLQLRYLQTVLEVSASNNSTTLLPMPLDLMTAFAKGNALGAGN